MFHYLPFLVLRPERSKSGRGFFLLDSSSFRILPRRRQSSMSSGSMSNFRIKVMGNIDLTFELSFEDGSSFAARVSARPVTIILFRRRAFSSRSSWFQAMPQFTAVRLRSCGGRSLSVLCLESSNSTRASRLSSSTIRFS